MKKIIYLSLIALLTTNITLAQSSNENFSNRNIYEILDELANEKIISLNSSIKPYQREKIYEYLRIALSNKKLSIRLRKQINKNIYKYEIFSKNYTHINSKKKIKFNKKTYSIIYEDSISIIFLKPIWGVNYKTKKDNNFHHFYGGLALDLKVNNNWHLYANLKDNTMSEPIATPNFFRKENGGNYKFSMQNDFSEMKGGLIYSFSWGNISLIKEHIQWGDNYFGSNILSGRTPSFPLIKFNAFINNVIELNYLHGWLVSEDMDSSASYISSNGIFRQVNRAKYIAANMISIKLSKNTFLSLGNSIVYSDLGGIHPGYLIPFFFYKSVDHTISNDLENQNSQLFINLSLRELKHLHVYSSLFIDEFKKSRIFSDTLNNFLSFKIGARLSNWPLKNITSTIELNYTNPMTYQHTVEGITFESNKYNLGHYMKDNSRTFNYSLTYKLKKKIDFVLDYSYAMHGDDLQYTYLNNYHPTAIPIRENKTWDCTIYQISVIKEFKDNIYLSMHYELSNIKGYANSINSAQYYLDRFTPSFYKGRNKIISMSCNIGF